MNDNSEFKKHPIQLKAIKVLQLAIKVNTQNSQNALPDSSSFELSHGHSEYDAQSKEISVKLSLAIDNDTSPFDLTITLLGLFEVNTLEFNQQYLDSWASQNAPLILYPYLREHVFNLTTRAGFNGLLLPLFEIPAFKTNQ